MQVMGSWLAYFYLTKIKYTDKIFWQSEIELVQIEIPLSKTFRQSLIDFFAERKY